MHPDTEFERKLERALVAVFEQEDYDEVFGIERRNGEPFLVCYDYDDDKFIRGRLSITTLAKSLARELQA